MHIVVLQVGNFKCILLGFILKYSRTPETKT